MQPSTIPVLGLALGLGGWFAAARVRGAEVDVNQLPPPAARTIDFRRDIQPILESECLRCHGPERPKSQFRLTQRETALKGGAHGVDILPGNSAQSPLIHYVARLVPDMEMPPDGRGAPLTTNQVALLRAWIDQGARWDNTPVVANLVTNWTLTPVISWTTVHGDKAKFRELEWQPDGWNGGIEKFEYRQTYPDGRSVSAEGQVSRDDYRVALAFRRPDLGFVETGFEQFRRYDADAGGYDGAFAPPLYRLGDDLHLDVGQAWANVGLTLPNWPKLVLGYEYHFADGAKSMLTWGAVNAPSGAYADARNIYPSVEQRDERTHVVKLGVSYNVQGFQLEDRLRLEFYRLNTARTDALSVPAGGGAPELTMRVSEEHQHTQVANDFTAQKELTPWWLAGVGYRYSWLDGDSAASLAPRDAAGQPASGSAWSTDSILLDEVWQVADASSQFRLLPTLMATAAVQGQWKRQDTFGDVNLDEVIDPTDPTAGIFRIPATERSTLDLAGAEENLLIRYAGLPFTALFAEARLSQDDYTRDANQDNGPHAFDLGSEAAARWQDFRVGFNSSPWRTVSFGGHYRHRDRQTDYDYPLDQRDSAYPGFIQQRRIVADEVEARVVWSPLRWWRSTFTYQFADSDYRTTTGATSPDDVGPDATPGGRLYAGRYLSHTVSGNFTLTPVRRVYFGGTVSYQHTETTTADNGSLAVAPYRGDLCSLLANVTCLLDQKTDLTANYLFSQARYGQHNVEGGLPLGLDYDRHGVRVGITRQLSKSTTARLQYGHFAYDEPSSGHLRDYTAHQILAVLSVRWR